MATSSITVLVVDDSDAQRRALVQALDQAGFTALEAASGEQALQHAAHLPDVVLLDFKLPDLSGREVCRRLKSDAATAAIPIVHCSSSALSSWDRIQALRSGADAHLTHPVKAEELIATINSVVRGRASVRKQVLDEMASADEQQEAPERPARARIPWLRYAGAAAGSIVALLFTLAMPRAHENPVFFFFLIAVATAAWVGGRIVGLVTALLCLLELLYFVIPPGHSLAIHISSANDAVDLVLYTAVSLVTVALLSRLRSARSRILTVLRQERALRVEHEHLLRDLEAQAEALRRTADFNRQMLESSTDCIEILDLDGRLLYMNVAGQRLLEIPDMAAQLLTSWLGLWQGADAEAAQKAMAAARNGGVGRFQGFCPTMTGIPKWWDVVITPLPEENGAVRRLLAVSRDMTDRKHAEEALIRSEKLASVGRMAATIAHEINNPLEAVMNAIFLARMDPSVSPQARAHLTIAEEELQRAAHITRRTLGFYRETGKTAEIEAGKAIDEVLELLKARIAKNGLRLIRRYQAAPIVTVVPGEFRQVVSNLIANAVDASPRGGALHVRVAPASVNHAAPMVRITIADQGCGIMPEHMKHIFEPFFTTKDTIGTGLGLWVTQGIVQKHGGVIRVRSRVNRGTTFAVYLPATTAARSETAAQSA